MSFSAPQTQRHRTGGLISYWCCSTIIFVTTVCRKIMDTTCVWWQYLNWSRTLWKWWWSSCPHSWRMTGSRVAASAWSSPMCAAEALCGGIGPAPFNGSLETHALEQIHFQRLVVYTLPNCCSLAEIHSLKFASKEILPQEFPQRLAHLRRNSDFTRSVSLVLSRCWIVFTFWFFDYCAGFLSQLWNPPECGQKATLSA